MLRRAGKLAWARCWLSASAKSRPRCTMRLRFAASSNGQPGIPKLYASAGIYPQLHAPDRRRYSRQTRRLAGCPGGHRPAAKSGWTTTEGAPHATQREGLARLLEISATRKRPILIHCRPKDETTNAWDDLFQILEAHWRSTGLGGIMHCFGGNYEQAARSLDLGFSRLLRRQPDYPKAQPCGMWPRGLPLDGLLVETDAPWLAPAPYRGKRNEPAWVLQTALVLAELSGLKRRKSPRRRRKT